MTTLTRSVSVGPRPFVSGKSREAIERALQNVACRVLIDYSGALAPA